MAFKVGVEDAEFLGKEFYSEFKKEDLINLDKYKVYIKMVIDGKTTKSFSAKTLSYPHL